MVKLALQPSQVKLKSDIARETADVVLMKGALVLAPVLAKVGKPITKAAVKTSIVVYEKTKSAITEAGEAFEDIIAESQGELTEEQAQKIQSSQS